MFDRVLNMPMLGIHNCESDVWPFFQKMWPLKFKGLKSGKEGFFNQQ